MTGGFRAFWLLINIYHIIFGANFESTDMWRRNSNIQRPNLNKRILVPVKLPLSFQEKCPSKPDSHATTPPSSEIHLLDSNMQFEEITLVISNTVVILKMIKFTSLNIKQSRTSLFKGR